MNFQNLEYFLAVARENNITKASEHIGISQQALSNQISRIEEELGCKLFDRKHGFELTFAGKTFQESALKILDINKQTEQKLSDITRNIQGELRIGVSHTRGQAILPLVLPEFIKQHPYVSLSLVEDTTSHLEDFLEHGNVDLLIGFKPFMSVSAKTIDLMKERLFIVASNNLLCQYLGEDYQDICQEYRKTMDLKLLKNLPFVFLVKGDRIRRIVDSQFSIAGFSPIIRLETVNSQTGFALAAEGIGLGIVPELYLTSPYIISGSSDSGFKDQVELLPFPGPASVIAIGYNEDRYLSNVAKDFIKITESRLSEL